MRNTARRLSNLSKLNGEDVLNTLNKHSKRAVDEVEDAVLELFSAHTKMYFCFIASLMCFGITWQKVTNMKVERKYMEKDDSGVFASAEYTNADSKYFHVFYQRLGFTWAYNKEGEAIVVDDISGFVKEGSLIVSIDGKSTEGITRDEFLAIWMDTKAKLKGGYAAITRSQGVKVEFEDHGIPVWAHTFDHDPEVSDDRIEARLDNTVMPIDECGCCCTTKSSTDVVAGISLLGLGAASAMSFIHWADWVKIEDYLHNREITISDDTFDLTTLPDLLQGVSGVEVDNNTITGIANADIDAVRTILTNAGLTEDVDGFQVEGFKGTLMGKHYEQLLTTSDFDIGMDWGDYDVLQQFGVDAEAMWEWFMLVYLPIIVVTLIILIFLGARNNGCCFCCFGMGMGQCARGGNQKCITDGLCGRDQNYLKNLENPKL